MDELLMKDYPSNLAYIQSKIKKLWSTMKINEKLFHFSDIFLMSFLLTFSANSSQRSRKNMSKEEMWTVFYSTKLNTPISFFHSPTRCMLTCVYWNFDPHIFFDVCSFKLCFSTYLQSGRTFRKVMEHIQRGKLQSFEPFENHS